MSDPKEKRVELILQQLQQLPTLPNVAVRILEVTGREDSSAPEVVSLISSDQSLTSKILQLVHRASLGVKGEVNSVDRAVVLLGFDVVRSAVLAVSVFQAFESTLGSGQRFQREAFWKHSIAVACCAELLAEALGRQDLPPTEAFVCGLLHDIGKVALDTILPKSFDRVVEAADLLRGNLADLERSVIGLDHMVIGKRLAERWHLPSNVRDCIWLHGQHPDALPATVKNTALVNLVTLADTLVREQHIGYSGNYTFPVNKGVLLRSLGADELQIERAQRHLVEKIQQRAAVLGLGKASSNELYLSALNQANQELGRISEQLAAKNRRLGLRAKFFDALAQFQGELRPDAPPALVLQAIGQTAGVVLGAAPVAVFSVSPGGNFAEVILVDVGGDVIGTSVVDCLTRLTRPPGGDGPILNAGDDLEWLLANISPRLAFDQRYWMCLGVEGDCIGGVLWGARTGEAQRLSPQVQELTALAGGWGLALRTAQIREESRTLAEQLAEANRQLHNAQNELLRSRTLVSVGEMAAGAAHEMNNPLAVISGRSQLLASQMSDPKLKHAANTIFEQSHRLSQIITDLMAFAKPQAPNPSRTDLAEILDRALFEARNQMADGAGTAGGDSGIGNRRIELTMGELPPVYVDAEQVQMALTEVLHNALQATDERDGLITVHAAYDPFSARVVVTVTDNGCGMDDETLRRAFDPFFSSLPAGRRRGMGLAKALRWVESSNGSIRLESHVNQGTRAMVLLPAVWDVDDPGRSVGQPPRLAAEG